MVSRAADTKLYRKDAIRRRFFGLKTERPRAEHGSVVVLTGGPTPIVLWPGQKATPGEAAWSKYDTKYTIDTGRREYSLNGVMVPAKGGDVHFKVDLSASYRISDPVLIIDEGIDNATPILNRVLTETISRVTERYDIEEVQEALNAVRDVLDKGKYVEKIPFTLSSVTVIIQHDDEAKEFLQKRRQQRMEAKLLRERRELITSSAEAELLELQNELKKQQLGRDFELEGKKQEALSDVEIQRMRLEKVYEPMIQHGLWGMLVQRLAQNPAEIDEVSRMIVDMQSQQTSANVSVLAAMINSDVIEDRDLRDVAVTLVQKLEGDLGVPLPQLVDSRYEDASYSDEPDSSDGAEFDEVEDEEDEEEQ